MVEPTESESKEELDRFCDALISIRAEIKEIEDGKADREKNVLTNAPHTQQAVISDKWNRPYAREKAAYPAPWLRVHKHWPVVGRIEGPPPETAEPRMHRRPNHDLSIRTQKRKNTHIRQYKNKEIE